MHTHNDTHVCTHTPHNTYTQRHDTQIMRIEIELKHTCYCYTHTHTRRYTHTHTHIYMHAVRAYCIDYLDWSNGMKQDVKRDCRDSDSDGEQSRPVDRWAVLPSSGKSTGQQLDADEGR